MPDTAPTTLSRPRRLPRIIGHRGAPGYRPEHTAPSYRLAIDMGVDAVEPDLVMTADGVVVIRHESELSATTDVAAHPDLAERRCTKWIEGRRVTGWFAEDLTLAEIKRLRAVERLPEIRPRNARWDGACEVLTLDELLLLLAAESRRRGHRIGLHAELKSAARLRAIGLDLESAVLSALRDHGLERRDADVHLQSFEPSCLRRLRQRTDLRLVQLVEAQGAPAELVGRKGLHAVSQYADAIGLAKSRLLGTHSEPAALVQDAQAEGLKVLAFTVRDENRFLAPRFRRRPWTPAHRGDAVGELHALFDLGVDGVFCDQPDTALSARSAWRPVGVR